MKALAMQMLCSALWCWPAVLHTNPQPLEGREFHLPTFMCKMMAESGFSRTDAVLGRELSRDAELPVSPWLTALWSINKTQAPGRACLLPSMPSLTLPFFLPTQSPHCRPGKRNISVQFLLLPPPHLGLACMTSEHLHLVGKSKWAAQVNC